MSTSANVRAMEILMVEDSPGDVRLIREAFGASPGKAGGPWQRLSGVWCHLHAVEDGIAALDFLYRRAPWEDRPRPDLVLLDLDLPRMDGCEVLSVIKGDPALQTIPVVVLTTSQSDQDVLRAYELRANCCVTKPVDPASFIRTVRAIEAFWLTVARLPASPS